MPSPSLTVLSELGRDALDDILTLGAYQALALRQEAEAELAEAAKVVSPADYPTPELRGDAIKLWDSIDHEVILSGPAETGKTYTALHKLNMLMWKYPGAQAAIVRKTYQSMHGTVLQTYRRILGKDTPVHAYGGEKPEWFDYPNGSRVFIGGMDNSQKVLSSERDLIYVNQGEELELDDWETLTTRSTGRGGVMPFAQIFGDCNPGPATHWILQRPSVRLLNSRHEDNPTLYDRAGNQTEQGKRTMAILDALTGTRYKRLRLGLWVSAEGMVYDEYDRSVHLVNMPEIRDDWLRFRVIDFGYTNPFVCQWWAEDPDGRLWRYRELYVTQRLVEDVAPEIIRLSGSERIAFTIADHDAEDRATLARHGVPTVPAIKEVSTGIQSMQKRLQKAGDGKPRMLFVRDALVQRDPSLLERRLPTCTEEEIDSYVWARGPGGVILKEVPEKRNDHGMDTSRYASLYMDRRGAGQVSEEFLEAVYD